MNSNPIERAPATNANSSGDDASYVDLRSAASYLPLTVWHKPRPSTNLAIRDLDSAEPFLRSTSISLELKSTESSFCCGLKSTSRSSSIGSDTASLLARLKLAGTAGIGSTAKSELSRMASLSSTGDGCNPYALSPTPHPRNTISFLVSVPVLSLKICVTRPSSSMIDVVCALLGMSPNTIPSSHSINLPCAKRTNSKETSKEIGTMLYRSRIHVAVFKTKKYHGKLPVSPSCWWIQTLHESVFAATCVPMPNRKAAAN
mmetsp:Transcript_78448/g.209611  ORF Transcript_78448/g.209611 Transcript_78448/m.209611 type:complete len:259 (+) Transcript_78448:399-1175(+)